jgi:signal transduction histidine kinase
VLVARDVTERHRLEERTRHALDALLHLAHALIGTPLEETTLPVVLARQLASFTTEALGEERVLLSSRDPETGRLHSLVASGITLEQETEWRSTVEGTRLGEWWGQEVVARLERGEVVPLAAADVPLLPLPTALIRSQRLLAPLLSEHRLIGVLVLRRDERKPPFTPHEEALLLTVAQFCALVLGREQVLLEREEARAHALALGEANRQMEAFVGMVSHELRTPLTSMKLSLQLIQQRLERCRSDTAAGAQGLATLPTSLQDLLVPAERQAMRLERLINDLLVASRLREGALELRLQRTDLCALVQEVVAEQQAMTAERVIELQAPSAPPLLVQVDRDRLRQAVVNYLTNALKYSPETAPVGVGVEREADQARVWVRDQGPGIPPEEQLLLWERFHRVPGIREQSGPAGGLGLGLYITRRLIEQQQGQVGLSSTPGKGTTFWLTLPLERQDSPASQAAP